MAITYTLSPTYASTGISGASVQYGNGQTFDVLAALVAGGGSSKGVGGSFSVTDASLIGALDSDPAVVRQGGAGGTTSSTPTVGYVVGSRLSEQVGDGLILQADGFYHNTPIGPYGLLANRPSIGAAGDRGTYFATDDNGGALYQVQAGAWVRVAPKGTELKYADSVSNVTGISTAADVTGLAISFTVADRPVMVEALLPLVGQVTSTGQPTFFIVNSTGVTTYATGQPPTLAAGAFAGCPLMKVRIAAGTGALSLKVTAVTTAGTVTVFSNSARKSYIQAYEV